MPNAHAGLNLSNAEFEIMGAAVDLAFARQGVAIHDREELAKLLGKMRTDVIGK